MSEDRPTYIPCASGNQALADFRVRRYGDLIEIAGHPIMHLTPQDALYAAQTIHGIANHIIAGKTPQSEDLEAK